MIKFNKCLIYFYIIFLLICGIMLFHITLMKNEIKRKKIEMNELTNQLKILKENALTENDIRLIMRKLTFIHSSNPDNHILLNCTIKSVGEELQIDKNLWQQTFILENKIEEDIIGLIISPHPIYDCDYLIRKYNKNELLVQFDKTNQCIMHSIK